MKTHMLDAQKIPRSFAAPLNFPALPCFFTLAFLPGLARLRFHDFSLPRFCLAASLHQRHVSFTLLRMIMTARFWSANWMMLSGDQGCATMMH